MTVLSESQQARRHALGAQLALVSEASAHGPFGERGRRPMPGSARPTRTGSCVAEEFQAAIVAAEGPQAVDDVLDVFEHRLDVLRRGLRRAGPAPEAAARHERRRRERRRLMLERRIREDHDLAELVAERERVAFEDGRLTEREEREEAAVERDEDVVKDQAEAGDWQGEWLLAAVANGPRARGELLVEARAAGIGERVLRGRKARLGVEHFRSEDGRQMWCRPTVHAVHRSVRQPA